MGLPTTWFLLNLVQSVWCGYSGKQSPSDSLRDQSWTMCGDDLLAAWQMDRITAYEEIV